MKYLEIPILLKGKAATEIYRIAKSRESELGPDSLAFLKELESALYNNLTIDEVESLLNGVL